MSEEEGHYQVRESVERTAIPPFVAPTGYIPSALQPSQSSGVAGLMGLSSHTTAAKAPRCLDLFCCAGGAAMGLFRAGFHVTGVDNRPQPNYPFKFVLADAMTVDLRGYDLIWASPPCQAYSHASVSQRNSGKKYPDLLAATRERLKGQKAAWIIENVPGAPMRVDVELCGSMFGLRLVRHRWFECSFPIFNLFAPCEHHENPVVVVGNGTPTWSRAKNGGKCFSVADARAAMGINWMNRNELSQAIPPAYSEWLGTRAIEFLRRELMRREKGSLCAAMSGPTRSATAQGCNDQDQLHPTP